MRINAKGLTDVLGSFAKAHGHEVLAALGISGFIGAIVLAANASPAAQKDICKAEEEKGEPLTKMEMVKVAGKHYIPTAVSAVGATACIVGSTMIENKKFAAIATLCQITEDNLRGLKNQMINSIGEKKANDIVEEAAASKVSDIRVEENTIVPTKYGESVFYDPWSGNFFGCTKDRVEKAVNAINLRLTGVDFVSLNEFYDELDAPNTQLGNYAGFTSRLGENLNMAYGYGPSKDGRSCTVMDYNVYLEDSYRKMTGIGEVLM